MEELTNDIAELEILISQAKRQRVKNMLSVELNKLHSEKSKLHVDKQKDTSEPAGASAAVPNTSRRYQVKLSNYAWDQSAKFVKFYVTLPKVQSIAAENITCKFTEKSLELEVKDLDNKDHIFVINNLLYKINPAESTWKVKSDMILINAAKVDEKNWQFVTEIEKRSNDSKNPVVPPAMDTSKDPSDGLMSLMQKMYNEGDDEMKRTIAKAFHESQSKSK